MKQWVISIVNCEDSGGEFFHLRVLGLALLVTYSIIINYVSGTLKINLFIIIASKVSEISPILHGPCRNEEMEKNCSYIRNVSFHRGDMFRSACW